MLNKKFFKIALLIAFTSFLVQAADVTSTVVTKDNIEQVFSYEKISEQVVRAKAKDILASGILTRSNLDNQGSRRVYEALLERILDDWRYPSTLISWFIDAHDDSYSKHGGVGFSRYADWEPWSLDEHFSFTPQDESNIKVYANRHKVTQHPFMKKIEAEQHLQSYKDYFANPENIKFLHDLQVEGLALNLIYKAIGQQKPETMKFDNPNFYEGLNIDSVNFDFIPVYVSWSKVPNYADLKIPR